MKKEETTGPDLSIGELKSSLCLGFRLSYGHKLLHCAPRADQLVCNTVGDRRTKESSIAVDGLPVMS